MQHKQLSNAINLKEIADKTEGYSGSDLKELCRDAAIYQVRDYVRKEQMRSIALQLDGGLEEERYESGRRAASALLSDLLFLTLRGVCVCVRTRLCVREKHNRAPSGLVDFL